MERILLREGEAMRCYAMYLFISLFVEKIMELNWFTTIIQYCYLLNGYYDKGTTVSPYVTYY